jgi:2-hydroxy-6-oxonona-2,4-dienedioate hydrolase
VRRSKVSRRNAIGIVLGGAALLGAGYVSHSYRRAVGASRRRISGISRIIQTRHGQLEYATAGEGRPFLMIHGTGGGYDQGLSFSEGIVRRGHRVIAPSRFGYLRSDFPAAPSSENQADAFVDLLNHLDIDKLPVAGGSAGALSAVQFALRHPDRCAGLILLVPAANVSGRDPVEMSSFQRFMVETLSGSDFLYWAALNTVPDRLVDILLATDPELLISASPDERRRAYRILEELMPISARSRGMINDAQLAGRPARVDFSHIAVPTLIISVEDDRFGTAATARHIARAVPGAKLVIYPTGGHIWLDHDGALADEVGLFLDRLR